MDIITFRERTFGSKEFTQFAGEWGFGQSEGSVGTLKHLMRKAAEDGRDVHLDLLEYRNTPIPGLEYSPAQFLMSPKTLLFPKLAREVQKSMSARHQRQKKYHDHDTRTLPQLQVGDPVTTQQGRVWNPAITEKHESPRSFKVKTKDGQVYRWKRKFLQKSSVSLNWYSQHLQYHP